LRLVACEDEIFYCGHNFSEIKTRLLERVTASALAVHDQMWVASAGTR
jgi:hypothetical protein